MPSSVAIAFGCALGWGFFSLDLSSCGEVMAQEKIEVDKRR
jgi:hypothetical protein